MARARKDPAAWRQHVREYQWRKRGAIEGPSRPEPTKCELCGRVGKVHFDHDHETGKFRGWLCRACNVALGTLGDNIVGLMNAIAYLRRNS